MQAVESSDLGRLSEDILKPEIHDAKNRILFPERRVTDDDTQHGLLPVTEEHLGTSLKEGHCSELFDTAVHNGSARRTPILT